MYWILDIIVIIIIIIRFFGLLSSSEKGTPMLGGQIKYNQIGSNRVPVVPSVNDSVTVLGMVLVLRILLWWSQRHVLGIIIFLFNMNWMSLKSLLRISSHSILITLVKSNNYN